MDPKAKQRVVQGLLLSFGLTMVLVGGLLLWFSRSGIKDLLSSMKKAQAVETMNLGDLKPGDHVTVDVRTSIGYAMTVYEIRRSGNGRSGSQKDTRYYAVPVFKSGDASGPYDYLVLVAQNNYFGKLDSVTKEYLNYWEYRNETDDFKRRKMEMSYETGSLPEGILLTVDGRVDKLNSEELEKLKKWFGGDDYGDYMQPYVIRPILEKELSSAKMILIMSAGTLVIGIVLLLICLFRGRKQKTVQQLPPMQQPPLP